MELFDWNNEGEKELDTLFDHLDKDGSGSITYQEVKEGGLLQAALLIGPSDTDDKVQAFLQPLDKDGDGKVTKQEFKTLLNDFFAMFELGLGPFGNLNLEKLVREQAEKNQKNNENDDNKENKTEQKSNEQNQMEQNDTEQNTTKLEGGEKNENKQNITEQNITEAKVEENSDTLPNGTDKIKTKQEGEEKNETNQNGTDQSTTKLEIEVKNETKLVVTEQTKMKKEDDDKKETKDKGKDQKDTDGMDMREVKQKKVEGDKSVAEDSFPPFEWTEETERKFEDIFNDLDQDETGELVFDEIKEGSLKKGAQILGRNPTDTEVNEFVAKLDKDGDGAVTKEEFRTYLKGFLSSLKDPKKLLEDAVDTMLQSIDKDGNGLCSKEEFKHFIQGKGETPLTDEEVEEIFSAADKDGDKTTLNRNEILDVLQRGLFLGQLS